MMMRFYKLVPEWQTLVQSEDGEWVARIDASSMMRELERDRLTIESLTAERDELKRRLDEEFANMDATMQGWDKLCEDGNKIEEENERLRKALEMAGKRLYKEGAPQSYVDDVEAVLDGKEVEYYD